MPDTCSPENADTCGYDTSLPNALWDPNAPNNGTPQTPQQQQQNCATQYSALANTYNQKAAATTPTVRSTLAWMAGGAFAGSTGGWVGVSLGALGGLIGSAGESASYKIQAIDANTTATVGCSGYQFTPGLVN
jgi:hypothetical protein